MFSCNTKLLVNIPSRMAIFSCMRISIDAVKEEEGLEMDRHADHISPIDSIN